MIPRHLATYRRAIAVGCLGAALVGVGLVYAEGAASPPEAADAAPAVDAGENTEAWMDIAEMFGFPGEMFLPSAFAQVARGPWTLDDLSQGWSRFLDWLFVLDMAIVLSISILLAAAIAYHPSVRSKASRLEEIEQPKTFIMYSMVAAVVAQIVQVNPAMGLVVFGLGGLLRFRTDVGEAKDTGRVILVTVVGLCCGLKLYPVAVLGTAFGFVIISYLESAQAGKLIVRGLDVEQLEKADHVYAKVLKKAGCKVIGGKKNVLKGQVSFIFKAPRGFDRDEVDRWLTQIPEELRGATDWEFS